MDDMQDPDVMQEIFGGPPLVYEVRFEALGYERQPVRKSGHIHMTATVYHQVQSYNVKKCAARMRAWLNDNYDRSKGWYVFPVLVRGGHDNYANKEQRWVKNDEVKEELGDTAEYLCLATEGMAAVDIGGRRKLRPE